MTSPLDSTVLFQLGPVPITQAIVTTWAIMVMLVFGGFALTRRLNLRPTRRQAALELIVATLDTQISETTGAAPAPYRAFIGTLFVFILVANWSSLVPGIDPPTAKLETDAALAVLVFLSVIWFGIRQAGVGGAAPAHSSVPSVADAGSLALFGLADALAAQAGTSGSFVDPAAQDTPATSPTPRTSISTWQRPSKLRGISSPPNGLDSSMVNASSEHKRPASSPGSRRFVAGGGPGKMHCTASSKWSSRP
jgi:hypothetical protein